MSLVVLVVVFAVYFIFEGLWELNTKKGFVGNQEIFFNKKKLSAYNANMYLVYKQ